MGAWGTGFFENDSASDWGYELEGVEDLSLITQTFNRVLKIGDDYLEAPEAEESLAAAEVIARLKGNWGPRDSYSEPVDQWVERVKLEVPEDVVRKARLVIDRVLTPPSELLELWEETGEFESWKLLVEQLKDRVVT